MMGFLTGGPRTGNRSENYRNRKRVWVEISRMTCGGTPSDVFIIGRGASFTERGYGNMLALIPAHFMK